MTRVRLPLLGTAAEPPADREPRFEPCLPEALRPAPGALVVVAGARAARRRAAADFSRALEAEGLRVASLEEAGAGTTREDVVRAITALAPDTDVTVVEGHASLGLYRATLSVVVGAVGTDAALRRLRGVADVEVEEASASLVAALAALVAKRVLARP